MDETISFLYHRATAKYGDLGLSAPEFGARLLRIRTAPGGGAAALRIHAEDLYLASACAAGSETAWGVLDAEYRPRVVAWCQSFVRPWYQARDLADSIWTSLFLPGRDGQPRIGSYEGMCALGTWLHTIAQRRAINHYNHAPHVIERLKSLPEAGDCRAVEWIERRWRQRRFGPVLGRSLLAACDCLDETDSLLLVWRFDKDIALGEIARRLGVHQSTVTRRIDRVCDWLRRQAGRGLAAELHLDREGVTECFRWVGSGELPELDLELLPVIRRRADRDRDGKVLPEEATWEALRSYG